MRSRFLFTAFFMMIAYLCSSAEAAPITYKLTGTMSGTLNGTSFTDAAFTWAMTSDTMLIQPVAHGANGLPALNLSFDIAGLGSILPSLPMFTVPAIGTDMIFCDFDIEEGIEFTALQFVGYHGLSSLGPIPVTFRASGPLSTAQGDLEIATASDMVFQASIIPEPLTLALFGAGLTGAGAMRRLRKTRV